MGHLICPLTLNGLDVIVNPSLNLTGFAIVIIAGEVLLAALKKLSKGSPRLSSFTERMTDRSPTPQ